MRCVSHLLPVFFLHVADPPSITTHPQDLKDTIQGKFAKFAIQATGTEPMNYHWQWKPAEEEDGSKEWQLCPAESCNGATLTIPSVQKCNEGSYCCVISNCAGTETSNPAQLGVGKNPPPPTEVCNKLAPPTNSHRGSSTCSQHCGSGVL